MQLRCSHDGLLFLIVYKEASEEGHVELWWNDVIRTLTVWELTYFILYFLHELHVRLNVEAGFAHCWAHANAVTEKVKGFRTCLQISFLFCF